MRTNTSVIQRSFDEFARLLTAEAAGEAQAPVPAAPAPVAAPAPEVTPLAEPTPEPAPIDPAVAPAPAPEVAPIAEPATEPAATNDQFGDIDPDLDLSDLEGLEPADPTAPVTDPAAPAPVEPAPVDPTLAPAPVDPAPVAPVAEPAPVDPAFAPAPAPAAPAVACASVEDVMDHLEALASAGSDDPVAQLVATGAVHCIHVPDSDIDLAAFAAAIDELEGLDDGDGDEDDIEVSHDGTDHLHVTQIDADLDSDEDYAELDRVIRALFDGGDNAEVFDEGSDEGAIPSEEPEVIETEEETSEGDEPAALETEDDEQADASTQDGAGEPAAEEDDDMVIRPVADEAAIASATPDQIQLVLSNTPEPTWNVIVAGVAAASIALKDQADPARSAGVFSTQKYHDGLMRAIASQGALPVLESVNASFYANEFKKSELAQEIRASVETESMEATASVLVDMRDRFLDRCNLVAVGSSKGFFSRTKNPMTGKIATALASVGVPSADAQRMATSIVATAGADMFRVIANEATNLMDKPDDVVEALRENIEDASQIDREGQVAEAPIEEAPECATASFGSRLATQGGTFAAPRQTAIASASHDLKGSFASVFGKLNMR